MTKLLLWGSHKITHQLASLSWDSSHNSSQCRHPMDSPCRHPMDSPQCSPQCSLQCKITDSLILLSRWHHLPPNQRQLLLTQQTIMLEEAVLSGPEALMCTCFQIPEFPATIFGAEIAKAILRQTAKLMLLVSSGSCASSYSALLSVCSGSHF